MALYHSCKCFPFVKFLFTPCKIIFRGLLFYIYLSSLLQTYSSQHIAAPSAELRKEFSSLPTLNTCLILSLSVLLIYHPNQMSSVIQMMTNYSPGKKINFQLETTSPYHTLTDKARTALFSHTLQLEQFELTRNHIFRELNGQTNFHQIQFPSALPYRQIVAAPFQNSIISFLPVLNIHENDPE